MALTRKQFDVLTYLERKKEKSNQRDIADSLGISLGSVNRTVAGLVDAGYLSGYALTQAGYQALEPYRVKRAVFLAAGFGSRLVPSPSTPPSLWCGSMVCG